MKVIDIDVKYILLVIVYEISYVVDIRYNLLLLSFIRYL